MALSLGRTFDRQIKMRVPYKNFFYDVGVFFTTKTNFSLFEIKPILKFGVDQVPNDVKIKMFKNVEMSNFCMNYLNLESNDLDDIHHPIHFESIKDKWVNTVICSSSEYIDLGKINYLKIYVFDILKDDFKFIMTERCCDSKGIVIKNLSGVQIYTSDIVKN